MIRLAPMLESEFEAYLEKTIPGYAADNVEAGYWSGEDALERSRKAFERLLPEGVNTKNQYLFHVEDVETNQRVGIIWLNAQTESPRPTGFIYDIEMDVSFRGKGYGKQAMLAIEEKARELGLKSIGLHVFAHNAVAKGLYEKIGYQVKSLNMTKDLD
ncbi:MAG: GNAT family N-acetyltransferase [Anaerolineales bacterium]|nr:GNAT family N-acetyltransferase [Anaerolineae bacterium]PWB72381.1 MAG: GNAT family N-acetyltransferase [Anaerolineales bacterium]